MSNSQWNQIMFAAVGFLCGQVLIWLLFALYLWYVGKL